MTVEQREKPTWNEAIAEASAHVEERGAAAEEAVEKQRPRDNGPIVAALIVLLIASLGWAGYRFQSDPGLVPIDEQTHLAWFVVDAAEAVEDFAADRGRLPEADEATTLLGEDVVYRLNGEVYEISLLDGERTVEYSSATPLPTWISEWISPRQETDQ